MGTPRETIQLLDEDEEGEKRKKKKSKMKATKDNKLLSFGDEAEDDEAEIDNIKKVEDKKSGKSAHDLLDDPKLSRDVGEEFQGLEESDQKGAVDTTGEDQLMSIREKLKKPKQLKSDHAPPPSRKPEKGGYSDESEEDDEKSAMEKKRDDIRREIKELTREMKKGGKKDDKNEDGPGGKKPKMGVEKELTEEEKSNDMLREFHEEQAKAKKAKQAKVIPKKGSSAREAQTLAMLAKFQQKLSNVQDEETQEKGKNSEEDEDGDNIDGDSWMSKSDGLKFVSDDPILAKDANTKDDNWFDIYDPRNPLNKRRREKDSKNRKRK